PAGSNTLISDEGIPGLTISTRKLNDLTTHLEGSKLKIEALAGTPKLLVMKQFLNHGLNPALFLAGIPGDIAGGVVMNAGVAEDIVPREFVEIVEWFEVVRDGKILKFQNSDIKWSYRKSEGWQPGIIVKVGLQWEGKKIEDLESIVKKANEVRFSKQPLDMPSCGSVFVNPKGHKSAKLIEETGLKGLKIGGAQVSTKHANFIVNLGDAKASDIHQLILKVQSQVKSKHGIDLHNEVCYLGKW
ncbi:MAG: UDP-N-acetylmuramate dehydrogenase, partial [Bdellovibrionales bacterium]|nr:UDP-N-acetylmuramate dehydrogenase [Bdellovibrionales bacterium]